jgi:glucans biosynthesis protein C
MFAEEIKKMTKMTTMKNPITERQYFIDWLRILLILSVFLFHVGMIFNTWHWHIKNNEQFGGILLQIMTFLHNWRMPLLFMLSGAGTYFALGKRTPGQYLTERFKRLVIPLAVGIFMLVPVQVYFEKADLYSSLPDFYSHMFDGIYPDGNFSWHHLWFIAYLFFVSLFISPFLNFLRSRRFQNFTSRIERIVTKPLALNIFIIPLLLSQIILRPFFETETNDLVNDWASMTYYIIFFLAGFILLPVRNITEAMRKYRFWYLAEVILVTVFMFNVPQTAPTKESAEVIHDVSSVFLAWSCAMTAIGFAKQYLNLSSPFRKLANEAIYPFYLLHQPIIVFTGYFTIQLEIPVLLKVVVVLLSSFALTTCIYWYVIRPCNLFRIIFGMKKLEKPETDSIPVPALVPAMVKDEIC